MLVSQKQEEMVVLFRENIEFKKEVQSKAVLGNGHNVGLQKCTLRCSLFYRKYFGYGLLWEKTVKEIGQRRILIVLCSPQSSHPPVDGFRRVTDGRQEGRP